MFGEFHTNATIANCNFSTVEFKTHANDSLDQMMEPLQQEYFQKNSSPLLKCTEKDEGSDKHLQHISTDSRELSSNTNSFRPNKSSRHSTNLLKIWLQHHNKHPYPNRKEKLLLSQKTNKTITQISTWFANARRRLKKENKITWIPKNRSNCLDSYQLQNLTITKVSAEAAHFSENPNWTSHVPHTVDPYEVNSSQWTGPCSYHKMPSGPEDNVYKSLKSKNMPSNHDLTTSVEYVPECHHQNCKTQQYYISMETAKNPYLLKDPITSSSSHPCMISNSFIGSHSFDCTTVTSSGSSNYYPPSCLYLQPRSSDQYYSNCVSFDSLPLTHDVHNRPQGIAEDYLRNDYFETANSNGDTQSEYFSLSRGYESNVDDAFHFDSNEQYTSFKHQKTFKAE